jgi:hypothetical protein
MARARLFMIVSTLLLRNIQRYFEGSRWGLSLDPDDVCAFFLACISCSEQLENVADQ